MRNIDILWSVLFMAAMLCSCKTKQSIVNVSPEKTAKEAAVPVLEWDKKMVEFGKIQKGDTRYTEYTFTNTTNVPVQVEIATTCHCTTLEYPRRSIIFNKGDSGTIKATFDSSEKDVSEKIDITVILVNTDKHGYPIIDELFFSYEF